jgi:hypothetical protein
MKILPPIQCDEAERLVKEEQEQFFSWQGT